MSADVIRIPNLTFYGYHGVTPSEREVGRRFSVDVELVYDLAPAGQSDELEDTIDYAAVCDLVERVQSSRRFKLMEALAHRIAEAVLTEFPVEQVTVRARKHYPPVGATVDYTEVEITRPRQH